MEEMELCIVQYRRLLQLLEEDAAGAALGLRGDLLTAYTSVLEKEEETLRNALRSFQSII